MTNKKKTLAAIMALSGLISAESAQAHEALWLRDAKISPDGKEIVFGYLGDIWTVPVKGGRATRLTTLDSYESNPIWSPDGKSIAFASDRHGNFDIFIMPSTGGKATRLTKNSTSEIPESFTPDGKEVLFSAAIQDPAKSALFPSSRLTEVYAVPVKGGVSRQVLGTPAQYINWGAGKGKGFGEQGAWMLYQDQKGMENEWRKHHTSSVTRDIWLYDASTGKHTNLTAHAGEDRDPVADGKNFYFLSERDGGSMNVYTASIANPQTIKAVTNFKEHPVRFLSKSDNGTLCYTYNGEIYTQTPGGKPVKITVDVVEDMDNPIEKLSVRSGARGAIPSPDGKEIAFIYRGDVFVTSVEYKTTKQITKTPEAESHVAWSHDGKALVYASQRDGKMNIYKATMGRPDDEVNFANATIINEEPLFKADGHERNAPDYSPDGKKLAFILDRNRLQVMDVKSGKVKELTDGSTHRSRSGSFGYVWSPDSKWIATEVIDKKHDPYSDIAIINVETGEIINLTNSGYFDEMPRWVMDGNALLFISERYGMRNHASWGSEYDAMLVFLNRDAYDKYRLNEEDYALAKEIEKRQKKDDKKDDKDKKDNDKSKEDKDKEKVKAIKVEKDGIADRIVRLTPMSSAMSDAIITSDGENLYYLTRAQNGTQLWKLNLRKDEHKMISKLDGASGFSSDKSGKTMFITGSQLRKLDPKSDKLTSITYSSTMNLDRAAERKFMYDYVTREERERFYTKDMHGVNWDKMTKNYSRFLPHINNNYDFAELLSELLGELNVSHTGGRYSGSGSSNDDRTASLGVLYDLSYAGKGMKVDEIISGGPFDRASSRLVPGAIIEAIDGTTIDSDNDLTTLLTDRAKTKTLVTFTLPGSNEKVEEVVLPISSGANNSLLYDRWVKNRAAEVDRMSGGRLGYVHIQSMGDDSFRTVYSNVLGKYNDREGIIIDVRWNGGGRLHEDIEVLFSGKKYFTQVVRGDETCDMPSRRWNKPSIMITNEACYSNAHGTPWVYKNRGLGKLVGAPVPGTMTSVNWVTMQDPTMVFGIPVTGYRLADGSYLENTQLEPDVLILNDPATVVKGQDAQLKAAVEELLKEIDSANKK